MTFQRDRERLGDAWDNLRQAVLGVLDDIRFWLIRVLGLRECGAFGGTYGAIQRWCHKPLGHSDSCAYDTLPDEPASQPGFVLRARARGWKP